MTKKITKMPIDTEFSYWLYKNHLEDWNKLWELSKEYDTEQLTIPVVVVPKGTLCECKKHSLKTNYGFEICTKCGNEFDDQHNALQRLYMKR